MLSLLFKNAFLIDGLGTPGKKGSLLVEGEKIKEIGPANWEIEADEVVDLDGLVLAPGFIDIHTHRDATIGVLPMSENQLYQGVTTEVSGNCGFSPFPAPRDPEKLARFEELMKSLDFRFPKEGITWTDLNSYIEALGEEGFGTNMLPLVAHGALRVNVLGSEQRTPNEDELRKMKDLLKESLIQGAWGMSSGLAYAPGSFSNYEEIKSLCEEIRAFDSYYVSHIRNEGDQILDSLDEIIQIGKETGCKVNISHLKAMGVKNWHQVDQMFIKISQAQSEGVDITADQYPYNASSTILGILVPKWANDGGADKMCERILSAETRANVLEGIEEAMNGRGGPDRIVIASSAVEYDPPIGGKSITEVSRQFHLSPVETIAKLLVDNDNVIKAVYLSMADEDVEAILSHPEMMVGSDGLLNLEHPEHSHPRAFGTFPRVLGYYVREKKILTLEAAIRKMTSLPAMRIGLSDRGLLKSGYIADLTVFDPEKIIDKATFINADQRPEGIVHIIMNGEWILREGRFTGKYTGKILRKTAVKAVNAKNT